MSLLAATWTSAIATVLLVLGAVVTARQTRLLQEQAERDITQRHRAQASQVFTWVEKRPFDANDNDLREAACIKNTSGQPVYDILLGLGPGPGREASRDGPCSCRARMTSDRASGRTSPTAAGRSG